MTYWRRCHACKGTFKTSVPADRPTEQQARCPFCKTLQHGKKSEQPA